MAKSKLAGKCGAVCPEDAANDYLRIFTEEFGSYRRNPWGLDYRPGTFQMRDMLIKRYSFAVPNQEAIEKIVALSPIVEMGAGSGYWAKLLADAGATVHAYDKHLPGDPQAEWKFECHYDVRFGVPDVLATPPYSDGSWTLFLCWPYMDAMAYDSLQRFSGKHIVYIGEGDGGCTGTNEFHETLATDFELREETDIPQWPGIHDSCQIWRRINSSGVKKVSV